MLNLEVNIYAILVVRKHTLRMTSKLKYLKEKDKNLIKTSSRTQ